MKILFQPNWNLHKNRVAIKFFMQLLNDATRIGARSIKFVDKSKSRNPIALHLAVNCQRLSLYAANRTQDQNSPVKNSKGAFNFNGEVNVTRGVNKVDRRIMPMHASRSARDSNTTFLLKLHVIHGRSTVMNFTHFVSSTRIEEYSLTEGRFPRVNMSGNTNIAQIFHV